MASGVPYIEYHADDYGLFMTQSQRILDCQKHGRLNGVSIMPNSDCLEAAMALLAPVRKDVEVSVHLNLLQGRSLSQPELEPGLADGDGILRGSFGRLLLRSFLPGREKLRGQLKMELRAQIRAVAAHLEEGEALRLDSHAHYHMVPVVFDALMDVIREDGLDVSYIRMPYEHVGLYLRHLGALHDFAPINLVKVLLLNNLVRRNQRKYRTYLETMDQKLFMGVFLSGRMYRENVEPLLADAIALAQRKNCGIEILAHPGGVFEEKDVEKLTNREDVHFLTNQLRNKEATLFEL